MSRFIFKIKFVDHEHNIVKGLGAFIGAGAQAGIPEVHIGKDIGKIGLGIFISLCIGIKGIEHILKVAGNNFMRFDFADHFIPGVVWIDGVTDTLRNVHQVLLQLLFRNGVKLLKAVFLKVRVLIFR